MGGKVADELLEDRVRWIVGVLDTETNRDFILGVALAKGGSDAFV